MKQTNAYEHPAMMHSYSVNAGAASVEMASHCSILESCRQATTPTTSKQVLNLPITKHEIYSVSKASVLFIAL